MKGKRRTHGGSGAPPLAPTPPGSERARPRLSGARLEWDPVLDAMRGIARPMPAEEYLEVCRERCAGRVTKTGEIL